jgi:hypothetical protein
MDLTNEAAADGSEAPMTIARVQYRRCADDGANDGSGNGFESNLAMRGMSRSLKQRERYRTLSARGLEWRCSRRSRTTPAAVRRSTAILRTTSSRPMRTRLRTRSSSSDTHLNELGARGIGEIGLARTAAAITSAIHHATGVRVREQPVRIEDLLASEVI